MARSLVSCSIHATEKNGWLLGCSARRVSCCSRFPGFIHTRRKTCNLTALAAWSPLFHLIAYRPSTQLVGRRLIRDFYTVITVNWPFKNFFSREFKFFSTWNFEHWNWDSKQKNDLQTVWPAWCVNVSVLLKSTGALQHRHYYTIHFGDTDALKRLPEVIVDQKETNCRFDGCCCSKMDVRYHPHAFSKRGKMLVRTNSVNDWSPLVFTTCPVSGRFFCPVDWTAVPLMPSSWCSHTKRRPCSYASVYTQLHTHPHTRATDGMQFHRVQHSTAHAAPVFLL